MKALITGIAGFAGNYLTQLLLSKGIDVYGLSEESEFRPFLDFDRSSVRYYAANLLRRQQISSLVRDIRPDLVFHLAARSSPSASVVEPLETFEVNFGGTLNLLDSLRAEGLGCRFLMVSSSHVYGNVIEPGPVKEEAPLKPATPYAASKAAAEMAVYQYWKNYQIEGITVRSFNYTGAGQREGFVCPDLARKVVEIERGVRPPEMPVANLHQQIDFSDVRDVVRGYYSASVNGAPGEVYNLCSGKATSVQIIAEHLISHSGRAIELRPAPGETRADRKRGIIGDNSRASKELGWQPAVSLPDTLSDVLKYARGSYNASTLSREAGVLQEEHDVCS